MCFATQGHSHIEDERIRGLLELLEPEHFSFDRERKLRSAIRLLKAVRARRPAVVVMEGTGTAGGITLLAIDALLGIPFIFSSGDAVGPYLRLRSRLVGALGGAYERLLCRRCAGYIGWTPYLVGRAMTFGSQRAMTAAGWTRGQASAGARERVRASLGIAPDTLVAGLVGSLHMARRIDYVYGAELVRAIRGVQRRDVAVCVVGDGSGLPRLKELAGDDLGSRVLLPGRVPPAEVPDYLAAFDLASLPQSVDRVGSFRYTTKMSEYLAAELPIVTGETPLAYDLDEGCIWRVPGPSPWSPTYVDALSGLLASLSAAELAGRREAVRRRRVELFDKSVQQQRAAAFVRDILANRSSSPAGRGGPPAAAARR